MFSTVWKTFSRFFHTMEEMFPHYGKNGLIFPQYGRIFDDFSMLWKNISRFFHAMEKLFDDFLYYGKTVLAGFKAVLLGC